MRPQSAKAKGRRLQVFVATQIRLAFGLHEDDIRSISSGANGEDVLMSAAARRCVPFSFECKNQERVNIWDAWAQAQSNAGVHSPAVVIKKNHSDVLCTVRWRDFLDLVRRAHGAPPPSTRPPHDSEMDEVGAAGEVSGAGEASERAEAGASARTSSPVSLRAVDAPPELAPAALAGWLRRLATEIESKGHSNETASAQIDEAIKD